MPYNCDSIIGLDIGGANIKIAVLSSDQVLDAAQSQHGEQVNRTWKLAHVQSIPFPLWKFPRGLSYQIQRLIHPWPQATLAVTMTGELADGFSNRQQGVSAIIDAVAEIADGRRSLFYRIADASQANWLDAAQARQNWLEVAAANWHAIAKQVGSSFLKRCESHQTGGFLIDIGSTTTDIIPIRNGQPAASGLTDYQRLSSQELIYVGVSRTPICSLLEDFDDADRTVSVAREFFATVADAFRITGELSESPQCYQTADGQAATRFHSLQRMARMVGNDFVGSVSKDSRFCNELLSEQRLHRMSCQVIERVKRIISTAIRAVVTANGDLPPRFFLSGQGEWLAQQIIESLNFSDSSIWRMSQQLGIDVSTAAGAYSVAKLAADESVPNYANNENSISVFPLIKHKRITTRVVKLGGSLLDWSNTPRRISDWIDQQKSAKNCWIVGGGKLVAEIRRFNHQFGLDETSAHSICLDLMSVNGRLLNSWFSDWPICRTTTEVVAALKSEETSNLIIDFAAWIENWQSVVVDRLSLTENWDVTSDSCAAFFARAIDSDELVLLKSCDDSEPSCDVGQAIHSIDDPIEERIKRWQQMEIVDASFNQFAVGIPVVRLVNLRK